MLVWIKFAFNKENKNIKNAKKAINLKTLKFKTILFNKYINKTMLAIINFPKINEKCIKILKYLHKTLVFERVNDKNHTIAAIWNNVKLSFFLYRKFGLTWTLDKLIKMLQVLLNFSNRLSLVVTSTNLLILLLTKKYSLGMAGCVFTKKSCLLLLQIKVIAPKSE